MLSCTSAIVFIPVRNWLCACYSSADHLCLAEDSNHMQVEQLSHFQVELSRRQEDLTRRQETIDSGHQSLARHMETVMEHLESSVDDFKCMRSQISEMQSERHAMSQELKALKSAKEEEDKQVGATEVLICCTSAWRLFLLEY